MGCNNGCGLSGFGGGSCLWIILIIILICCCGCVLVSVWGALGVLIGGDAVAV